MLPPTSAAVDLRCCFPACRLEGAKRSSDDIGPYSVLLVVCQPADRDIVPVVIDPVELESFADAFFPTQMEELRIPGVSFVLVQNGEIVLAKGYGYANLEAGVTISPEHGSTAFGERRQRGL